MDVGKTESTGSFDFLKYWWTLYLCIVTRFGSISILYILSSIIGTYFYQSNGIIDKNYFIVNVSESDAVAKQAPNCTYCNI
jgi:hypothetical protein